MAGVELAGANDIFPLHGTDHAMFGTRKDIEPASEERLKFVYSDIVQNHLDVRSLRDTFEEHTALLGNEFTRLQGRAVVTNEMLQRMSGDGWYQSNLEVVMPLDDITDKPTSLIYLGRNVGSRKTTPEDLSIADANYTFAKEKYPYPRSVEEIFDKPYRNGYEIAVLNDPTNRSDFDQIVTQVHKLYQRFGWEKRADVEALFRDESYMFTLALKDKEVVSVGLSEFTELEIGGVRIPLVELTEAASDEEHFGQGLYTAIATRSMIEIADLGYPILTFSESNLASLGVQISARIQGREFCKDIAAEFGFDQSGFIRQQVGIESFAPWHSPYNDLAPNFTPYPLLIERYAPFIGSFYQTYVA